MKLKWLVILGVVGFLVIVIYLAGGITDSFSPHPLYPTYESLKAHGFYAFVLPQSEIQQRRWTQTISIFSWTMHCGLLRGDTYNPLQVWYTDDVEERVFEIQLGPWGMIWNHGLPTVKTEVELKSKWSAGTLMYYTQTTSEGLPNRLYRFSDLWSHDVEIRSNLSVTETVGLIEQFEYIGPPLEKVNDPWDCK
jgi:hypothetical protein